MKYATLMNILGRDKWIQIEVDRDLIGAHYGIYNPSEGKVYLSQAMFDLYQENPEYMKTKIMVVDLSNVVERAGVMA